MTLTEIRNQILTKLIDLQKNKIDTFSLLKDGKTIKVDKGQDGQKNLFIKAAFEELETASFVKKVSDEIDTYWILDTGMGQQGQDLQISSYTAELIANFVNQYRESLNLKDGICDKMALNEGDLQNAMMIAYSLLNKQEGE